MVLPLVVALYCRFSVAREGGSENVEDQESWGREWAEATYPGVPIEVFVDDGLTAAKSDVFRPDFQRLREWIAGGRVAALWCSETSRLARTRAGWFQLVEELEAAGIEKVHTYHDGVRALDDLGTDVDALMNHREVRKLRKRVNAKLDEIATQGRPSGGRCYGYRHVDEADPDKPGRTRKALEVVDEQAEILREVAGRILVGETRSTIAKDLAGRGVVGANGGPVGSNTITSWMTSATIAGLRRHRGELVRGLDGRPVRGTWEPVLDVETWQAVQDKFATTKRTGAKPTRRKYRLSGLARCGSCGDTRAMVGNHIPRKGRSTGTTRYLCKGCGTSINAAELEGHVVARLLDRLDVLAARLVDDEHEARRDELNRDLALVRQRREMGGRMLARGDLSEADYPSFVEELEAQEAALVAELAELPRVVAVLDTAALRKALVAEALDGNTVDEQREVIGMFIARVVVDRAQVGGSRRRVDLDRVRIEGPGWGD